MSEPSAMFGLMRLLDAVDDGSAERLVASTVRLLCKATQLKERGYVMKLHMVNVPLQSKLTKLFPHARHLFMYRDSIKVRRAVLQYGDMYDIYMYDIYVYDVKYDCGSWNRC